MINLWIKEFEKIDEECIEEYLDTRSHNVWNLYPVKDDSAILQHTDGKSGDIDVLIYEVKHGNDRPIPGGGDNADFNLKCRRLHEDLYIIGLDNFREPGMEEEMLQSGADYYFIMPEEKECLFFALDRIAQRVYAQQRFMSRRKNDLFQKFLESGCRINSEMLDNLFADGLSEWYQIGIVRILPAYQSRKNGQAREHSNSLLILDGLEILNDIFKDYKQCLMANVGIDIYILLRGNEAELKQYREELRKFLAEIEGKARLRNKIGIWIALGPVVASTEIVKSYQNAVEMMHERLLYPQTGFLPKTVPFDEGKMQLAPAEKQLLVNALEDENIEDINRCLNRLKKRLITFREYNGKDLYKLYQEIMALVFFGKDKILDNSLSDERNTYVMMLEKFEYFWSVDDMFDTMSDCLSEYVQKWKRLREEQEPVIIRKAKHYIGEYFGSSISLQEVSDYVGLNSSYFSDYFKRMTNQTFSQYLTEIRIRHAKHLLLEGGISLDDIAEQIGYRDKKYFSKMFKKETKYTPGEYKKKYG